MRGWTGGVHHVIEVGGADTLRESIAAARPGGTLSLIGVLAGSVGPVSIMPVVMRQLRLQGIFVGHRQSFVEMVAFMDQYTIEPTVGPVFELSQFSQAFQALRDQEHFGKICLKLD